MIDNNYARHHRVLRHLAPRRLSARCNCLALFSSGHYFEAECTYTCLRVTIRRGGRKSEFPSRVLVLLSLPVPGVKWVNLARTFTVQSRHRDCASKSNWNIGNALPFRFHDFCSPSSTFALPSSMCTPTNFPRIPFLSLLRSPFFPFEPVFRA